ncbi:hypothetical protein OUZ56_022492 [Daphnia magna]|uniref:Uncharacterized protein n=1 Tax=Daphnia magna TaxID=35525 RepID=A0ABR0AWK5_9CRUS|nr:hypothetical protein OUZ56_022492 [Daphnia magna]
MGAGTQSAQELIDGPVTFSFFSMKDIRLLMCHFSSDSISHLLDSVLVSMPPNCPPKFRPKAESQEYQT